MLIWSREPDGGAPITSVLILVDTLSPAERRDLANARLRAARSAKLSETRIFLLDIFIEIDNATAGGRA